MKITINIGGLIAIGFDEEENYMITLSHSGRGLYETQAFQRIARDGASVYPENGVIKGIGPMVGIALVVIEKNYETDQLAGKSPKGIIGYSYSDGMLDVQKCV